MRKFNFDLVTLEGKKNINVDIKRLYIAGFAGRDIKKTIQHIDELAKLGVARPESIPSYYRNGINVLLQDKEIQVAGNGSSGEVEFVMLKYNDEILVGIGSDHTDRVLEAVDVTKAKQVCPKPIGKTLWRYDEVKDHWDDLIMQSWQIIDGKKVLYQDGKAGGLLTPVVEIAGLEKLLSKEFKEAAMLGGTVAAIGGIRGGSKFIGKVTDTKLNRSLDFEYDVVDINK